MSIAKQRARIDAEVKAEFESAAHGQSTPIHEKYCGYNWYQVSEEESEVFGLCPADMPKLAAVHELYFCAVEVAFVQPEAEVRSIRAELPWLSSVVVDKGEWLQFAALFGISNRQAYAFFCKYEYWEVREGLVAYQDEPSRILVDQRTVEWIRESSGRWIFRKGIEPLACLTPNQERAGAYVTEIFHPYPDLGHASVDCLSVKEGQELIENWWASVKLYVERGWLMQSEHETFQVTEVGRPYFEKADVPIAGL